ncbi:MAG: hypothetical protein ACE361_02920 [Aureliella sp.]
MQSQSRILTTDVNSFSVADEAHSQIAVARTPAKQLPNSGLRVRCRDIEIQSTPPELATLDASSFLKLAEGSLSDCQELLQDLEIAIQECLRSDTPVREAQLNVDQLVDSFQTFTQSVQIQLGNERSVGLFDGSCGFADTSRAHADILECNIFQADLSRTGDKTIRVGIEEVASRARIRLAEFAFADGLLADAAFELRGAAGSETFTFSEGTTANQIVGMVNLFADRTGVSAKIVNSGIELLSTNWGTDAFVSFGLISEGASGRVQDNLSTTMATGTDAQGTINGVPAFGSGNTLRIRTASLDLQVVVGELADGTLTFRITAGGVDLSLPEMQARIGIGSLSIAHLGGPAGRLYEITSGQRLALDRDPGRSLQIVREALAYVSNLRERMSAYHETLIGVCDSRNDNAEKIETTTSFESHPNNANVKPRFLSPKRSQDFGLTPHSKRSQTAPILVQPGTSVLHVGAGDF